MHPDCDLDARELEARGLTIGGHQSQDEFVPLQSTHKASDGSTRFHNGKEMILGAVEDPDVFERVRVQDKEVRDGARSDGAQLTNLSEHLGFFGGSILQHSDPAAISGKTNQRWWWRA